jgi:hypothetical protein
MHLLHRRLDPLLAHNLSCAFIDGLAPGWQGIGRPPAAMSSRERAKSVRVEMNRRTPMGPGHAAVLWFNAGQFPLETRKLHPARTAGPLANIANSLGSHDLLF